MDNLLVWGSNEEEHDRRLAEVQKRVLQYGLLLNHDKCVMKHAFCMTCSLLMLVEDAIGDHTEEAYSRAGLITAL